MEHDENCCWNTGVLGDIAINIRRTIKSEEIELDTPYIGLEHMPRASIALTEWGNANEVKSNKYFFMEGELLFGKLRPYFHKVGIAPVNGVCSTDILVITPKSPSWYAFVVFQLSSSELINFTTATSTGTKMPRTNWSDIASFEVSLPPTKIVEKFNEIFKPMASRMQANIMQSNTLIKIRNSLIPNLMTGKIDLSDNR